MRFDFNFGTLRQGSAPKNGADNVPFRIALLGDFSGRAIAGKSEAGASLAKAKPIKVDVDNLDDVIERMGISVALPLSGLTVPGVGESEQTVEVEIGSMDDFHPDELFDKLEVFAELASLRQRLSNEKTFKKAAAEVRGWAEDAGESARPKRRKRRASRATHVPGARRLSEFEKLLGGDERPESESWDVDALMRDLVTPFIVAEPSDEMDPLVAAVDESLSSAMRAVLHQSEFQSLESIWRGVEMLVRRLETNRMLQVVLYDISAEDIALDLSSADDLESTGLYKLLVEQPSLDANQGGISAILGYYVFEETPAHAELLGRIAKIAAAANAPFVAAIDKACLDRNPKEDQPAEVAEAWTTLAGLPEAKYLGLTVPQFLLRLPYGKKSDPIRSFKFEEFTPQGGVGGMLWGNGVLLVGLMFGQTFSRQGRKQMKLGSILSFDDMPYHFITDGDGEQVALPCTERLLSLRMAQTVGGWGYIPLLAIKGQNVVRIGSTQSYSGEELAGSWPSSVTVTLPEGSSPRGGGRQAASGGGSNDHVDAIAAAAMGDISGGSSDDLRWDTEDDSSSLRHDPFFDGEEEPASDDDDPFGSDSSSDDSDSSSDDSDSSSDDSDSSSDDSDSSSDGDALATDESTEGGDDADASLSDLLKGMSSDETSDDSSSDSVTDESTEGGGADSDASLSDLLKSMSSDENSDDSSSDSSSDSSGGADSSGGDDDGMDPELAKLLADL
jgi:type VI secretion system protein ImpC